MQDLLVVIALALLRIGIPAAAILGVGYVAVRAFKGKSATEIEAPAEFAGLAPAEWAKAMTQRPAAACWEQRQCDATARATCAAYLRPKVPCWLAVQVAEGKLRDDCPSCSMYRLEARRPSRQQAAGTACAVRPSGEVATGEGARLGSGTGST
jgi:hypothetical protein